MLYIFEHLRTNPILNTQFCVGDYLQQQERKNFSPGTMEHPVGWSLLPDRKLKQRFVAALASNTSGISSTLKQLHYGFELKVNLPSTHIPGLKVSLGISGFLYYHLSKFGFSCILGGSIGLFVVNADWQASDAQRNKY